VAILVGPTSMDNDLARLRLWDDELLAVVPAGHRLALRSEVSPKDLDEVGFAWCEAGDEKAHAFFRLDDYRGGSPVADKLFETPQALLLGVRAGEGVICLPSSFIGQFGFADLALVQLRPSPVVHVDVACRRDTASDLIDSYMRNVRTLAAGAVSPVQDTA
jgi:DNA-binding transcriptional LysR family regulator